MVDRQIRAAAVKPPELFGHILNLTFKLNLAVKLVVPAVTDWRTRLTVADPLLASGNVTGRPCLVAQFGTPNDRQLPARVLSYLIWARPPGGPRGEGWWARTVNMSNLASQSVRKHYGKKEV